ncbi:mitogen-activated protein kinase kinase kinase [Ranunculus cassubicifolius]
MDSKLKRRKPKQLDRRNAIKNIDYEAPSTSTSSSYELSSSPPRTRSLDLSPYANQTSFRIEGNDGEIDRICWSLGLSGPDDFAISTTAWEASKARSSSDIILRRRSLQIDDDDHGAGSSLEEDKVLSRFGDEHENNEIAIATRNSVIPVPVPTSSGIKGARPPLLAPPPMFSRPQIDNIGSSSWDIISSFAPEHDSRGSSNSVLRLDRSSSDEEEDGVRELSSDEDNNGMRLGVTTVQSESCSFSESNDDDSSSTTTDPMYVISPSARFKRNIKSWTKGSLLGSGSFGTVFEGLSDDGFFFAVKEVSLLDQGSQARQSIYQLEQEISLLSQFEHENIVQYLGTDKDEEKLYIFLELVTKGSLAQTYQKYNLQDHHVSAYTRQILHGLMYLHDRNVVHRDIKCANILVDANGSVKLADFGLAKATKLNDVKSCKGTAFWMAPEVVNRKGSGYGLAADIWSLGCTVLEMLTRQIPYSHLEGMQALFRIGKGEPPPIPNSVSKTARDFILRCLRVKADDRPTAAQLLEHPFVKRSLPLPSAGPASPSHPNWRRL